ncbi:MAG: NAD(P)H-dependent oxidoreductase [Phycicoccus sp.]|nr:NAD(P)H-dependent oxidoreductase [Phycicoccus sp.]
MKIGIILGSVRQGRLGATVAQWVVDQVATRDDADYVLLDLAAFTLPILTSATVPGAANRQYDTPEVTAWSQAIDACDGFLFVTPEYNHSVPGAFKNAFDSIGPEWARKGVGIVSYGAEGGVRAVEHWRQICANFHMVVVRPQVSLSTFLEWSDGEFTPNQRRPSELTNLVNEVVSITTCLRS